MNEPFLKTPYEDATATRNAWKDDPELTGWTIYQQLHQEDTRRAYAERFFSVNNRFKRFFLWPAVKVLAWWSEKHYKGVPDEPQNRLLQLWNETWQQSVHDLYVDFLRNVYAEGGRRTKTVEQMKTLSSEHLTGRFMRELNRAHALIAITDTVQREFINLFTLNLVCNFNHRFGHDPEAMKHLLYTSVTVNDPQFYFIHVCPTTRIASIKASQDHTCCELEAMHGGRQAVYKTVVEAAIETIIYERRRQKKSVQHLRDLQAVLGLHVGKAPATDGTAQGKQP